MAFVPSFSHQQLPHVLTLTVTVIVHRPRQTVVASATFRLVFVGHGIRVWRSAAMRTVYTRSFHELPHTSRTPYVQVVLLYDAPPLKEAFGLTISTHRGLAIVNLSPRPIIR